MFEQEVREKLFLLVLGREMKHKLFKIILFEKRKIYLKRRNQVPAFPTKTLKIKWTKIKYYKSVFSQQKINSQFFMFAKLVLESFSTNTCWTYRNLMESKSKEKVDGNEKSKKNRNETLL